MRGRASLPFGVLERVKTWNPVPKSSVLPEHAHAVLEQTAELSIWVRWQHRTLAGPPSVLTGFLARRMAKVSAVLILGFWANLAGKGARQEGQVFLPW